jgi:RNA 3'-terminal phosphate cyclase-like protein
LIAGITNDNNDPSVDTFRTTTLPLLRQFGVPVEDLELKIVMRGAPPLGGGEVHLKVPIVHPSLRAVHWMDVGMVKWVRGVAYSTRVSPQMANRMVDSVRGILNRLIPDVYVFTDHYSGQESGKYVLCGNPFQLCYVLEMSFKLSFFACGKDPWDRGEFLDLKMQNHL